MGTSFEDARHRVDAIRELDQHGSLYQIEIAGLWVGVKARTYDKWTKSKRRFRVGRGYRYETGRTA